MKVTQENTDYITDMDEIGYFKDANEYYNMLDASVKKSQLWEKIIEDTTMQDYIWADWATQFSGSDSGSFCQNSDEMKRNRLKITHRQGLVAQIRWVPEDGQSYTGFYSDGFADKVLQSFRHRAKCYLHNSGSQSVCTVGT